MATAYYQPNPEKYLRAVKRWERIQGKLPNLKVFTSFCSGKIYENNTFYRAHKQLQDVQSKELLRGELR